MVQLLSIDWPFPRFCDSFVTCQSSEDLCQGFLGEKPRRHRRCFCRRRRARRQLRLIPTRSTTSREFRQFADDAQAWFMSTLLKMCILTCPNRHLSHISLYWWGRVCPDDVTIRSCQTRIIHLIYSGIRLNWIKSLFILVRCKHRRIQELCDRYEKAQSFPFRIKPSIAR